MVLFSAVILFLLGACGSRNANASAAKEEKNMSPAVKPKALPIPPIDAMAPDRIATATFAMG
jgi:hypothetical protein